MSPGEAFTEDQRREIEKAIRDADRISGLEFSVHVGPSDGDSRRYAEALHAALPHPATSVLVHVDPVQRTLEIVTGSSAQYGLSNQQVALASLTMQSAFVRASSSSARWPCPTRACTPTRPDVGR